MPVRLIAAALLLASSAGMASGQQAEPAANLLTLAKGAVLRSASVDATAALALTDGDPATHWSTGTKRNPPPYRFVFELIAPATIGEAGIVGAGARPGGIAGGSAKGVVIEASAEGPDRGFRPLGRLDAAPEGATLVKDAVATPIRWLRFTIEGAQSDTAFLYFADVVAHGEMVAPEDARRFTGVFSTGRADSIELKQNGTVLTGCYVENGGRSSGTLSGSVSDGVALLSWSSDQKITGSALLTVDSTGALAGVRYRQKSRSAWGGPRAAQGTKTPCSDAAPTNAIQTALETSGEAQIYGILFDHDSATPRASSQAALNQLREALAANATLNVDIEGHTDSDGDDAYNRSLSERRAASVVGWLVEAGIAANRMRSVGKGEAEPAASNSTADGKALNRRVEVVRR